MCVCASVKNTEVFFLYLEKQTVKYEKEGRGEREGGRGGEKGSQHVNQRHRGMSERHMYITQLPKLPW